MTDHELRARKELCNHFRISDLYEERMVLDQPQRHRQGMHKRICSVDRNIGLPSNTLVLQMYLSYRLNARGRANRQRD